MKNDTPENSTETEAFKAQEQTWQHIDLVMRLLMSGQIELMRRAVTHDRTKLIDPEREKFAQTTSKLWGMTYGSSEYNNQDALKEALAHHYEYNRHHPQFFQPRPQSDDIYIDQSLLEDSVTARVNNLVQLVMSEGDYQHIVDHFKQKQLEHTSSINNMNLFDLIEMFIDWNASVQRHANGDINKSIDIGISRFGLSPQLVEILRNTIPWVHDSFVGLNNQQDLQPPI